MQWFMAIWLVMWEAIKFIIAGAVVIGLGALIFHFPAQVGGTVVFIVLLSIVIGTVIDKYEELEKNKKGR